MRSIFTTSMKETAIAVAVCSGMSVVHSADAATPAQIVQTLRLAGTITGGTMPTSAPEYAAMLVQVENGNIAAAAKIAAESAYAARFLLRRLALQMQNNPMEATAAADNDSTAFLVAHFAGANGLAPSISKIFSNNVTCLVGGVSASSLTGAEIQAANWTNLTCTAGQAAGVARTAIPAADVGGFMTLSRTGTDNSFAQNAFMAGTNLRAMKMMWEISTGKPILEFAVNESRSSYVPRFVPQSDPSFLVGQGQTACISCHGGGLVSLRHGYSTVADRYDFTAAGGLIYQAKLNQLNTAKKGFGSMANQRDQIRQCTTFLACNPDSENVDVNEGWDLATVWGAQGILAKLGWNGATVGQGLASLGQALGQATIVYTNLVNRVSRELCPLGVLPAEDITSIAAAGKSTDDIRTIIAQVAANPACQ